MTAATTTPARILVVDDNAENLDLLSRWMKRKGYSVLTANGGRAAILVVAQQPVDLILLDIMMPDVNGLDVLQAVRETHSAADLPIIMVTAKTDTGDVVEALGLGANDYVTKPIDFPIVLARVEAQLRMRSGAARAVREARAAAPEPEEIGPGRLVAGKYRIESIIGSGAFGTVYSARHLDLDQPMALKVLQSATARNADALERFQREGIAACRIRHPNAVAVTDFGVTAGGFAFLVMELLEGHSLEDELQRGRVPVVRSAEILAPLCAVLAHAHELGVVHRDIKPANVFLQRTPQGEVVKVLDFGIAKFADEQSTGRKLTIEGGIIGTPAYMAPERFRAESPGGASDVYSLGVMLYQMLAGRLPFPVEDVGLMGMAMQHLNQAPPPLRAGNPEVTPAVEAVVMRALRKDPASRPSAVAFSRDFLDALGMPSYRQGLFITPTLWSDAGPSPTAGAPTLITPGATTIQRPLPAGAREPPPPRRPTDSSQALGTLESAPVRSPLETVERAAGEPDEPGADTRRGR